jgi:hypothetical protein
VTDVQSGTGGPATRGYSGYVIVTEAPDVDFERRWTAWKTSGLAHERVVRQRLVAVVSIAAVIAFGALIAYALLGS